MKVDRASLQRRDAPSMLILEWFGGASSPPAEGGPSLDLRIEADQTIELRSPFVRLVGSANLHVTGTTNRPGLVGKVEFEEGGEITLQNLRYDLERGIFTFADPDRIDPSIELQLTTWVQNYQVTLRVSGTSDRLVPQVTSNPPLPQEQVYSLLAMGYRSDSLGSGAMGVGLASTILSQQISSELDRRTKWVLPHVRVDPFASNPTSGPAARVTVVQQLAPNWTVTLQSNLSSRTGRGHRQPLVPRPRHLPRGESRSRRLLRSRHQDAATLLRACVVAALSLRVPGPRPILMGIAAWLVATTAPPLAANINETPIASLSVESDGPVNRDATLEVLGLEIGGTLDRTLLRDAILSMYASTDAEWVKIEAAETPDGLDVLVRISVKPTVAQIHVEVGNRVLRKRIEKWLEVARGDVVSTTSIEAGARRITRKLRERGYADPKVDVFLDYQRATNTVAVTVVRRTRSANDRQRGEAGRASTIPKSQPSPPPRSNPARSSPSGSKRRSGRRSKTISRRPASGRPRSCMSSTSARAMHVDLEVVGGSGRSLRMELTYPEEGSKAVLNAIPDPKKEEIHPQQTDALAERVRERLQEAGYLLAEVSAELVTDESTGPF